MYLFHVPGMKCGGCLGSVTRALRAIDSAVEIDVNRWLIARGRGHALVHAHHKHR